MIEASFKRNKNKFGLSADEANGILLRLLRESRTEKAPIEADVFFGALEKEFRASVDFDACFPSASLPAVFVCEEGLVSVLTVLYSHMRLAFPEMRTSLAQSEERVCLTLDGVRKEKLPFADANTEAALAEIFGVSPRIVRAILLVAEASSCSVSAALDAYRLTLTLSLPRFRAVPTAAYSCSSEQIRVWVERAMDLFFVLTDDALCP